ncbi:hypothetical protein TrLO_g8653 [Triparma laevis f. longispina]|uniref:Uncharacterized protein n=1 Tax=Triparma laevis f. longispina TaxID=1714387 RepID=A0A9W7FUM9_9STRA|nr:hypothetical protein TrLO_g8653 [Triparma laevis f. longispina]
MLSLRLLLIFLLPHLSLPLRFPALPKHVPSTLFLSSFLLITPPAHALDATMIGRTLCTQTSTPSKVTVSCLGGPLTSLDNLSLHPVSANENGISTSSIRNPSKFSPPWSYSSATSNPDIAWLSLITEINSLSDSQILVNTKTNPEATYYYLHATVPTSFPPLNSLDDLEFILRPSDNLVLYRSSTRTSVFVYPLQQQVGDKDTNIKRLEGIRKNLNWSELKY